MSYIFANINTEGDRMSRKKNVKKIILICVSAFLVLCVAGLTVTGVVMGIVNKGNSPEYSPVFMQINSDSELKDKRIIFLGSSVTYGFAAFGNSFVDYLEKADGITVYKEAVSGTTLVDNGEKSYVARLKTIDKDFNPDAFVCQLSTNDATKKLPLGEMSDSFEIDSFDTLTVIGAMEYIIAYVNDVYGCPVVFYTGTKYDSEEYQLMVNALLNLKDKWGITVIDLWNSEEMNSVSDADYKTYMADSIHPTMKGYSVWWLPQFEKILTDIFK